MPSESTNTDLTFAEMQEKVRKNEASAELLQQFLQHPEFLKLAKQNEDKLPKQINTWADIKAYPSCMLVKHTPNPVAPVADEGGAYEWRYQTTLSMAPSDITIVEFGSLVQYEEGGPWHAAHNGGKPGTNAEFAELFSCPGGVLKAHSTVTCPQNFSRSNRLRRARTLWYFIGINSFGRRVGDFGVVEERDFIPGVLHPYDQILGRDNDAFPFSLFQDYRRCFFVDWKEGEDWIVKRFAEAAGIPENDITLEWDEASEHMNLVHRGNTIAVERDRYSSQHSMLLALQQIYGHNHAIRLINHITPGSDTAWFVVETPDAWRRLEQANQHVCWFFTPIELLPDTFNTDINEIASAGKRYAGERV